MKKIVLLLLIPLFTILAGNFQVRVSSTRVVKGQSLTVKLIAEGKDVKFPNIKEIDGVSIENIRNSSQIQTVIINGQVTTKKEQILIFELYPQKSLTIPPFEVVIDGKKYKSNPIKIEVVKGNSSVNGFTIKMYVNKKEAYLGEDIVLTVDAIEPLNGSIVQMQYTPPQFQDFFVKSLGGERQIRKGNVIIHELKYLLFPNKIGKLHITPAQVKVGLKDLNSANDPFGIFGAPIKWYSIRSNSLSIDVKKLPVSADLVGDFTISANVNKREVRANKPVNYTLEIVGSGNLEDFIDPKFDIPGVTVYSDDAKVNSQYINGKLQSSYKKSYVFISDRDFIIPKVSLSVFNPKTKKLKRISTKEIKIKVLGGANKQVAKATTVPISNIQKKSTVTKEHKKEDILNDEVYYAKKAYEEKAKKLYTYLVYAFLGGMVFMWLLVVIYNKFRSIRRKKRGINRHYSPKEALKILYPHIDEDPEVEKMVRRLYMIESGKSLEIDQKLLDYLASKYDKN